MKCEICDTVIMENGNCIHIGERTYHIWCILKKLRKTTKNYLEFIIDEFDTELRDYQREVAKDEGWCER